MENISQPQMPRPESGRPKGMMEAGKIYIYDPRKSQSVSREIPRPGAKQETKEAMAKIFFGENDDEEKNRKAAFCSMVEESGVSWETLSGLVKEGAISKSKIRNAANEYLRVMRGVSTGKSKEFEEVRDRFKKIISEKNN
jgi:hypothetical protein